MPIQLYGDTNQSTCMTLTSSRRELTRFIPGYMHQLTLLPSANHAKEIVEKIELPVANNSYQPTQDRWYECKKSLMA